MLGGDVLVLKPVGFLLRRIEHVLNGARPSGLRARRMWQRVERGADVGGDPGKVRTDFLEQGQDNSLLLAKQRGEQVQRQDLAMVALLSKLLRANDRFLGLDREFVDSHDRSKAKT